jgi:hypothetical protein
MKKFFVSLFFWCLSLHIILAAKDNSVSNMISDTTINLGKQQDSSISLNINRRGKSGLDSTVHYTAKDSVVFRLSKKKVRLKGEATMDYQQQNLQSEVIEISFDSASIMATGDKDSFGKIYGNPIFKDKGETFSGEKIAFNFKTKQGIIALGETKVGEGFYFGSKIKKVDETTLFVENGCYTACDDPHPHYYFGSPEMKVIANDRVFIDPVILYVEDVPVFILPVGIYFENNRGRRSGILVPQLPPSYQVNQGWIIPNMGYYWAISDYFDNKTTMTIFTKGGVVFNNLFRYNLRDKLNGDITLSYGLRRSSPDADRTVEWGLRATHSQTLIPDVSNISANINLTSTSFIRNFSTSLQDRLQQQLFSDAQYSYRFQNNSNFGITMQASQNLLTRENRVAPNISYSIPQIFPLKGLLQKYKIVESSHWLNDIGITYSVNANYSRSLTRLITPITGENRSDTSLRVGETFMTISHAPTISISPKLGFFSVTPSISYQERWFFRSINRRFNEQNTFVEDTTYSLAPLREFLYSFNLNVTTTLYGIMKPRLWGINALRHTFRPSLTLSYQPGFDENSTSYFSSYTDTTVQSDGTRRNVIYSKYALDGGIGITRASQRINYTFTNSIEAKIAQAHDTIPDKNLELLRFDISGNYDFLADSLQFSDININFRTPALSFINFNGSASFTLYDQIVINNSPRRINSFLASSRGTALRLTSISGNFSFSFSSQGLKAGEFAVISDTAQKDSSEISLGSRFTARNTEEAQSDIYGDSSPGYTRFAVPWSVDFSFSARYDEPFLSRITRTLTTNVNASCNITKTWRISTNLNYDLLNRSLLAPQFIISKLVHCWAINLSWTPTGFNRGYFLTFTNNATQLRDMRLEFRDLPAFR